MVLRRWVVVGLLTGSMAGAPAWASALRGRVIWADGGAVAGASVSVIGLPGTAQTDSEGFFVWSPAPAPPFELLVVLDDGRYMAPVLVQETPDEGHLPVIVRPLSSETVTVSTSVTPNIESPPASGMTTLEARDLAQRSAIRLSDAIENIPGVSRSSDLHAAVPSIRGLARGRTLILIDGARVSTERRAGPSATYLNPFFLEGLEVSRGPGSVAYGSDAFGGVIHALTRRPIAGAPFHWRFQGNLGFGLPERSANLEVSQGLDEGGFLFQGRYRDIDDYESPLGKVDNSYGLDKGLLARFQHRLGRGSFSLGWQSDYSGVGRPSTRDETQRTFQPSETSHRFTIGYETRPFWGFSRLKLEGFLGSYGLDTDRDILPTATAPREILESDVQANDYSFRAVALRPFKRGRIEFGVDVNGRFGLEAVGRIRRFDASGQAASLEEELSVEDARRDDLGLFLSGESELAGIFSASGGVRFDRITTRNKGGLAGNLSTENESVSGFVSLSAALAPGTTLTGQASRGFRDPTLSDRYFQGISGRGFVSGNPFLEPERSLQFDVALRHVSERYRVGLFAYHYRISDLVERFEPQDDLFLFRNRGRARLRGVELEFQSRLWAGMTLEVGAQVASGKALDDDANLDDVPVRSVSLVLKKSLSESSYLLLRGALYGRDQSPGPSETVVPGYGLLDAGVGWRLEPRYELRFLVRNLLDKDHPVSPDERAVGAPGLSGLVTLVFGL